MHNASLAQIVNAIATQHYLAPILKDSHSEQRGNLKLRFSQHKWLSGIEGAQIRRREILGG